MLQPTTLLKEISIQICIIRFVSGGGGKGQSDVQKPKQPLVWFNLLVELTTHAVQECLGREKADLCLAQPPLFLLYKRHLWYPSWRTSPRSSRCTSSQDGTSPVSSFKVRAFSSCFSLAHAGSVLLNSTLELSAVFSCLLIPRSCFNWQVWHLAAHVVRAGLH